MDEGERWMRQLWVAHSEAIYRFALRRLPGAAEDVTSETFLTAWRRRDDVPDDPRPWLFVTAKNIVMTHARGQARYDALLARVEEEGEVRPEGDIAEAVAERAAQRFAWLSLSPSDREALMLVGWDGLTNSEAAAVVGCTPATFAVRLFRARRQLTRARARTPNPSLPSRYEGVTHGS